MSRVYSEPSWKSKVQNILPQLFTWLTMLSICTFLATKAVIDILTRSLFSTVVRLRTLKLEATYSTEQQMSYVQDRSKSWAVRYYGDSYFDKVKYR